MTTIKIENKSSIEAAQDAIAKVNAMLIAKGKLKPSQLGSSGSRKVSISPHYRQHAKMIKFKFLNDESIIYSGVNNTTELPGSVVRVTYRVS